MPSLVLVPVRGQRRPPSAHPPRRLRCERSLCPCSLLARLGGCEKWYSELSFFFVRIRSREARLAMAAETLGRPFGRRLRFNFLETWGDPYYMG